MNTESFLKKFVIVVTLAVYFKVMYTTFTADVNLITNITNISNFADTYIFFIRLSVASIWSLIFAAIFHEYEKAEVFILKYKIMKSIMMIFMILSALGIIISNLIYYNC